MRDEVEKIVGPDGAAPTGSLPFTPRAKRVLELALRESLGLGHNYLGTEHILLGIVREGEGVAAQVLISLGADLATVRQRVIRQISGGEGVDAAATKAAAMPHVRPESPGGSPRRTVGEAWSAEVVRAGRAPEVFEAAHRRLAELVTGLGGDVDDSHIDVTSVDTDEGPGLRLVYRQEIDNLRGDGLDAL